MQSHPSIYDHPPYTHVHQYTCQSIGDDDSVLKDLVRPVPGVYRLSVLRQRVHFHGSADFWERRYAAGGTSGPGSYGELAAGKAEFLNSFVADKRVDSVIEFGCGDGNQLSLARYPFYTGLDVSRSALKLCRNRFNDDTTKSFFLYDGECFVDRRGQLKADLSISLDVIYHLIEDAIYEKYMHHLFGAADRFTIIYATNGEIRDDAAHVRHREFTSWVDRNQPKWRLAQVDNGPGEGSRRADFYVFERAI